MRHDAHNLRLEIAQHREPNKVVKKRTLLHFITVGHQVVRTEQVRRNQISHQDVNCIMTVTHQNEDHARKRVQPNQVVEPYPTSRRIFLNNESAHAEDHGVPTEEVISTQIS